MKKRELQQQNNDITAPKILVSGGDVIAGETNESYLLQDRVFPNARQSIFRQYRQRGERDGAIEAGAPVLLIG
jgi:hypothetical protein